MMSKYPSPRLDAGVDLLIIGGGVNGAGIARDAAGRGLKVALIEQSDLAAATSSASSKLIHGGLRYLELGEIRLVRESLKERERLLAIAPHIVYPMEFILPHVMGLRPRWQLWVGLYLYDHLTAHQRLARSRPLKLADTPFGAPIKPTVTHGFAYSDCAADDARLVVLNAIDAAERGATVLTRTRFMSAHREQNGWSAKCVDMRTGAPLQIRARAIVNAAGPWVDRVLRSLAGTHQSQARMRLIKGSHIVVPRMYEGSHAYILQTPDGRVVFVIPYEGRFTLIGTTDVPCEQQAEDVSISEDETTYLISTVNQYLRKPISSDDVVWSYAGVRPLVDDAAREAASVTRDYRLEMDAAGPPLLSVFGGKLTTYRKLAETALGKLHRHIGGSTENWTHRVPLPGGDLPRGDFNAFLRDIRQRWNFLPESLALRLARSYGTRIEAILGSATCIDDLGKPLGAGLTAAEIEYLIGSEWAVTTEDILWRRTKLGLHMTREECNALGLYMSARIAPGRVATAFRS